VTPEADDGTLVAAAQRGDTAALDALLRRHHDTLYALCRRMTRNDADAQDATQDAMIAIVRGLDRFDGRAAFTTWAYRITANACIDELRRRRTQVRSTCAFDAEQHDHTAPGAGPEIRVIARQTAELKQNLAGRLSRRLDRLPAFQRELIYLMLLREPPLSLRQVSQLKKIPISTLHSRFRNAIDRLRELCRELGEEWKNL